MFHLIIIYTVVLINLTQEERVKHNNYISSEFPNDYQNAAVHLGEGLRILARTIAREIKQNAANTLNLTKKEG
jgi:hypothetical protein